jgi:phage terminase large subunit-like protein
VTTEQVHPFRLFERLDWLTGAPLMSVIEPYRRRIFEDLLFSFDADGNRRYTSALIGRAKKNWKSADLCLSALYMLLVWRSPLGNDCVICSNDHDQARDTLTILKKLIACNPILEREVDVTANAVRRRDGRGTLATVASRETRGLHGGSRLATFYDEVGGFRDSDLFTALAPDPHRAHECLTYVTGYRGVHEGPGCPMYDYFQRCRAGTLPSEYFSWYDGEFSTDEDFMQEGLTPEERANPSLPSFAPGYLEEAYQRLSAAGYRQVHLNLPSQPSNAAFNVEAVERCMITGVRELAREHGRQYHAWFDGSGGSFADSCLALAYHDAPSGKAVVARVERQTGEPPFSPTQAIRKFAGILRDYGLARVNGDHWGGNQTRSDWEAEGISLRDASGERQRPLRAPRAADQRPNRRLRRRAQAAPAAAQRGLAQWQDPAARWPVTG